MEKTMELLVIHHSHTDIGYTDRQEKIEWHHIKYIERVIDILNAQAPNQQQEPFKWTCESFWCVEKFLDNTTQEYIDDFIKYVKEGKIGVSGNYLNCTDLLHETIHQQTLHKAVEKMDGLGLNLTCAMTADINGYGWGYPDALLDAGISNFYSALHTHHGFYPTNKKQRPFFWEAPSGRKILVWLGEHYNIGNDLGLVQSNIGNYMVRDGLQNEKIPPFELAEQRIYRYVEKLREDGYAYDFVPITVSGLMTDNAPPNEAIYNFIQAFNKKHGKAIKIKMVTLEELFAYVRKHESTIETFKGDWTDWWADGIGSTPNTVKHYRQAQRKYNICERLDPNREIIDPDVMETARYNLMFYSEHTWGYSSSIIEPWHPQVNNLDQRKNMYASLADEATSRAIDQLNASYGETEVRMNNDYRFKVINPHDVKVSEIAKVNLEILFSHECFDIVEEETGHIVPYQCVRIPRGFEINFLAQLEPKQMKTYRVIEKKSPSLHAPGMSANDGSDRIADLYAPTSDCPLKVTPYQLETPYFSMAFDEEDGITSLVNKETMCELIHEEKEYNVFTPIYEVTPYTLDPCEQRRVMGRNRKDTGTQRHAGKLKKIEVLEQGDVLGRLKLSYELQGTTLCDVILTGYMHLPKIDVELRIHKTSVWEPENLYLALPLTAGLEEEIWMDKSGVAFRPRVDQLPGSCIDFYSIQNGIAMIGKDASIMVLTPDTPLVSMGTIKAHPIKLAKEAQVNNVDFIYSWVMNNFWETNFKASLGGFYQFNYSIVSTKHTQPEKCFALAKAMNDSVLAFHMFDVKY